MAEMTQNPVEVDVVAAYGDIAAGSLVYPMAPQLLSEADLRTVAGALHGWETIANTLDPAMNLWSRRYGGGIEEGLLRLKLQTWFRHWVKPPSQYMVHVPRLANGVWYRLYRTSMRVHEHLAAAAHHAATLSEEDLVIRYSHVLGHGARERYGDDGFDRWWADVIAVLQEGDWHLAVYSPQWEAFISPVVDEPQSANLIERYMVEFPPMNPQLYPLSQPLPGSFDIAEAMRHGAVVEIMGDLLSAPPFGNWGGGVPAADRGPAKGRAIAGLIHNRPGRTQAIPVTPGSNAAVVVDAPNLAALLQDIYAVTGWRAPGVTRDAILDEEALEREVSALTQGHTMAIEIPETVFADAVASSPQIIPVYGRLVSTFTHVALDWRTAGSGVPSAFSGI